MGSHARTLNLKKLLDIGNVLHLIFDIALNESLFDAFLFSIKPVLEYTVGMSIGYVVGWLAGLCVGQTYVEYFAPAYLVDLGQLSYWRLLPYGFARNTGIAVAIMGAIVVAIINNKLLNKRIVSLYNNGTIHPTDIARSLGKSVGLIESKMNNLL